MDKSRGGPYASIGGKLQGRGNLLTQDVCSRLCGRLYEKLGRHIDGILPIGILIQRGQNLCAEVLCLATGSEGWKALLPCQGIDDRGPPSGRRWRRRRWRGCRRLRFTAHAFSCEWIEGFRHRRHLTRSTRDSTDWCRRRLGWCRRRRGIPRDIAPRRPLGLGDRGRSWPLCHAPDAAQHQRRHGCGSKRR